MVYDVILREIRYNRKFFLFDVKIACSSTTASVSIQHSQSNVTIFPRHLKTHNFKAILAIL